MLCGWRRGARIMASQMRAHFTVCPKRPAGSGHVDRRGGTRKLSAGTHRGRIMLYDWGWPHSSRPQMRAHFTICAKRPAASEHGDRRRRNFGQRGAERCTAGVAAPDSRRAGCVSIEQWRRSPAALRRPGLGHGVLFLPQAVQRHRRIQSRVAGVLLERPPACGLSATSRFLRKTFSSHRVLTFNSHRSSTIRGSPVERVYAKPSRAVAADVGHALHLVGRA